MWQASSLHVGSHQREKWAQAVETLRAMGHIIPEGQAAVSSEGEILTPVNGVLRTHNEMYALAGMPPSQRTKQGSAPGCAAHRLFPSRQPLLLQSRGSNKSQMHFTICEAPASFVGILIDLRRVSNRGSF